MKMKFAPLTLLLVVGAVLGGAGSAMAQSVWDHNGSKMLLEARGNERIISYLEPRRGISAGSGQILFRGRRVGNTYVGTAYTFRRGCPPAPYRVSGPVFAEKRIELSGASPRRAGCRVVGYTRNSGNAHLVFSYLHLLNRAGPPPANPPEAPEGPQAGPVQRITKLVPGGRIVFRIQDEDEPAAEPIRIDATLRCDSGRRVKIFDNQRTCQLVGITQSLDRRLIYLHEKLYTGQACDRANTRTVDLTNLCN